MTITAELWKLSKNIRRPQLSLWSTVWDVWDVRLHISKISVKALPLTALTSPR